jgi:phosphatidylserine decarboxylase
MNTRFRRLFYRNYHLLPHRLAYYVFTWLFRFHPPQSVLRATVQLWIKYGKLQMDDFEDGPFTNLEEFFLRRLKPDRRPIEAGMVSPVDGQVVASGMITEGGLLEVKGETLSFERLVGASKEVANSLTGGTFVILFLSPNGYHRVHMPQDGNITAHQWIPGKLFPQNPRALDHIPRVHERNARVVLHCRSDVGERFILIMIGAGAVSGMHILGLTQPSGPQARAVPCAIHRRKGEEIGYFSLGSTVVLLTQSPFDLRNCQLHACVQMGESLFSEVDSEGALASGQQVLINREEPSER